MRPATKGGLRSPACGGSEASEPLTDFTLVRHSPGAVTVVSAIVVRGPLGVGKSTTAPALAEELRGAVISMDEIPVIEAEWDGGTEELFLRANEVAAMRARPLLESGTSVVFDGCFYWLSAITDLETRLSTRVSVFTLKAPLEVCIERDRRRKHSYGEEAARLVFAKVSSSQVGTDVDATQEVPLQVEAILRALRSVSAAG